MAVSELIKKRKTQALYEVAELYRFKGEPHTETWNAVPGKTPSVYGPMPKSFYDSAEKLRQILHLKQAQGMDGVQLAGAMQDAYNNYVDLDPYRYIPKEHTLRDKITVMTPTEVDDNYKRWKNKGKGGGV